MQAFCIKNNKNINCYSVGGSKPYTTPFTL